MIRILEIFGGIGSATQAFKNIGLQVNTLPIEIDKNIINIFNLIHESSWHAIDIKWIDNNSFICREKFDIAVVGFPCQDISKAGKKQGLVEGTRSNLLWEAINLIKEMKYKPRYLLFENVKTFSDKKYENDRKKILNELEKLGYCCGIENILNAKNFGIPQNRERWFLLVENENNCSIGCNKKDIWERIKNIKLPMKPLKDFLEYVPIEQWKKVNQYKEFSNFIVIPRAKDNQLINGIYNQLWKTDKYVGTLNVINPLKITFNKTSAFYRKYKMDKEIGSLRVSARTDITNWMYTYYRSLTPRECGRLMGWNDKQIDKVIHLPKSHLYKAFGNAIVIPVLEEIFKILFSKYLNEHPIFKKYGFLKENKNVKI